MIALLYRWRHLIAVIFTLIGFCLIQVIANYLYLPKPLSFDLFKSARFFWHSGNGFFYLLLVMNWVIKPLLIYGLVIVAIKLLYHYHKTSSR